MPVFGAHSAGVLLCLQKAVWTLVHDKMNKLTPPFPPRKILQYRYMFVFAYKLVHKKKVKKRGIASTVSNSRIDKMQYTP